MINVLEFYTLKKYNCIMNTKDMAIQCDGVDTVLMSGSGSDRYMYSGVGSVRTGGCKPHETSK